MGLLSGVVARIPNVIREQRVQTTRADITNRLLRSGRVLNRRMLVVSLLVRDLDRLLVLLVMRHLLPMQGSLSVLIGGHHARYGPRHNEDDQDDREVQYQVRHENLLSRRRRKRVIQKGSNRRPLNKA